MIATGGTIASKEGDLGLTPAVTGEELAASVPGIKDICHLEILQLMNIDSTNMRPRQWLMIRDAIMENYNHIGHTNQHLTGVDSIFLGIDVYLQSSFYTDHIDVCIQLEILVEKQVLEISKYSNIVVGIVRTCIFCFIVCVKLVNLFFVFHIHVFSSFANVKQVAGNIES